MNRKSSRGSYESGLSGNNVWSIVLAGGNGERTRDFIERRLGVTKPKQYCSFVGSRSLLQHTVDRADAIAAPEHRLVVAARDHEREAREQLSTRPGGRLLLQPNNCGTAPGIFFPLTHVLTRDPDATVVIYPSDHFIYPEPVFVQTVARAISVVEHLEDRVLLLGAQPEGPETEYGWIQPGNSILARGRDQVRNVSHFVEKPTSHAAEVSFHNGAVWSTLIVVAKLKTLWGLGWRLLPDMMPLFTELSDHLDKAPEEQVLDRIYLDMPMADFSRDLIQKAPEQLAVMELSDLMWSDWGSPARITETLARIGARPAFADVPQSIRHSKHDDRPLWSEIEVAHVVSTS